MPESCSNIHIDLCLPVFLPAHIYLLLANKGDPLIPESTRACRHHHQVPFCQHLLAALCLFASGGLADLAVSYFIADKTL